MRYRLSIVPCSTAFEWDASRRDERPTFSNYERVGKSSEVFRGVRMRHPRQKVPFA
jgi:hypothetical protein